MFGGLKCPIKDSAMNQSRAAQATRLEMKRRALEYMERTMTADAPASDILKYEKLAREFVALEHSLKP